MHPLPAPIASPTDLRSERRTLDLTQEAVADALGIARGTLARIEGGTHAMPTRVAVNAAVLFDWYKLKNAGVMPQATLAKRPVGRPKVPYYTAKPVSPVYERGEHKSFMEYVNAQPPGYVYLRADLSPSNSIGPWVRYVRGDTNDRSEDLRESTQAPVQEQLSDAAWLEQTAKRYQV